MTGVAIHHLPEDLLTTLLADNKHFLAGLEYNKPTVDEGETTLPPKKATDGLKNAVVSGPNKEKDAKEELESIPTTTALNDLLPVLLGKKEVYAPFRSKTM